MDEQFAAAMAAIDARDYGKALRLLRPLAEGGHAGAQNSLGTLYQLGLGVDRNLGDALRWFMLSVGQGEGKAAHNIGTIYLTGSPEIPIDQAESKRWFRKARELGFAPADSSWYD
jgi:TPR repeat protein